MNWMLYVVLYLLLMVNGMALLSTFASIFSDEDLDETDVIWFLIAGALTPLDLIWLASL